MASPPDPQLGNQICRDATADNPAGRLPIQKRSNTQGEWQVALPTSAKYTELAISSPKPKEAAAVVDLANEGVAAFVIARDTAHASPKEALAATITGIRAALGSGWYVTQVASGRYGRAHDMYEVVSGTSLSVLANTSILSAPDIRNAALAGALGRPQSQLSNLPSGWGSSDNDYVLRLSVLKRVEFKKNSKGNLVNAAQAVKLHLPRAGPESGGSGLRTDQTTVLSAELRPIHCLAGAATTFLEEMMVSGRVRTRTTRRFPRR